MALFQKLSIGSHLDDKITSEHITTILQNEAQEKLQQHEDRQRDRYFSMYIFGGSLVFVLIILILFRDNPSVLEKVISAILGFGAGYGLKSLKKS